MRWLPWLVLGGALIAVERAAMFAFTVPGGTPARYGTAAATLIVVWVSGVLVGGVAFARAWHRARRP